MTAGSSETLTGFGNADSAPATGSSWLLERPRLVSRALGTPAGGLCIVTCPPGYGATTLLEQVARAHGGAVFWLRLTPRLVAPRDLAREVERNHRRQSTAGPSAPQWTRPVDPDDPGEVASSVCALLAGGDQALLVVDDLDPLVHADLVPILMAVIHDQPGDCRVMLRTRGAVPSGVESLLSSGRLRVLGEQDLALTDAEAGELVRLRAPALSRSRTAALVALAEGWVAAIATSLASVEAQEEGEPAAWLLGPGLDLLFDAELARLPDDEQRLLVDTSVLEVLEAAACDRIRGRDDSDVVISRLLGRGGYLREGEAGGTCRVHLLFAEYLRRRLGRRGRDAVGAAHAAAAGWCVSEGRPEAAIDHFHQAGDVIRAMAVLEDNLVPLLNSREAERVRSWYAATPSSAVGEAPLHQLGAAWAGVMAGDVRGAENVLLSLREAVRAQRAVDLDGGDAARHGIPGSGWLEAETRLLASFVDSYRGFPDRTLRHVDAAREYFGDAWSRAPHQAAALMAVRSRWWTGQLREAEEILGDVRLRPRTMDYFREGAIPSMRACLAAEHGRAHRALLLADSALDWLARGDSHTATEDLDARLAKARALLDLDRLEDATREAGTVAARARTHHHLTYLTAAEVLQATTAASHGERRAAFAKLKTLRDTLTASAASPVLRQHLDLAEARLRVEVGDPRAERLVHQLPAGFDRQLLTARLVRRRSRVEALRLGRELRPTTPRQRVDATLLLALCMIGGHLGEAETHLRTAGDAAYELGLHRALCGWPEELHALAERVARADASESLTRLLWVARTPVSDVEHPEVTTLSPGERELLTLLPDVLGNVELAEALGVSVNTVKTRLRRLYVKLDVHTREEAARRGRFVLAQHHTDLG